MNEHKAIRAVAYLEAFKGLLVIAAASGLLLFIHRDLHQAAAGLIEYAHLNPASKYPRIFLDAAAQLHDSRLVWLAVGAAVYSIVRLLEAYGLFYEKAWAEVLAAGSGGLYLPAEIYELFTKPGWLRAGILVVNVAVVALMLHALIERRRLRSNPNLPASAS